MSWEKYELRHLCTEIIDCVNKTAPISPIPTEYKMLRTSDIRNGRVNLDNLNCVSYETFEKWTRRGKLQAGDIIFTREAPLGEVGLVKNPDNYFLGQRLVLFRANPQVCDNRFLLYALMYHDNKQAIIGKGVGSTVLHLRVPECEKITIKAPKLPMQHRIADILSAYDDLIENNRKQIKLLEEAAQRLYKEWFVDLRFPGHEHTKIVDGVPEGWEHKTVAECLIFYSNGGWGKEVPTGKYEYSGKVIRGTDIEEIKCGHFKDIPTRYHTEGDVKKRTLHTYDIVFELSNGNINNIGRSLLINKFILENCGKNTICASFCKLLRPTNPIVALILYLEIQNMQLSGRMLPYKKNGANGINNFDFEEFLTHSLLITQNKNLVEPFAGIVSKVNTIQGQLTLLEEARDRLLPKLMSGEVEV